MALPKFLVNAADVQVGELVTLSREESHHAIRVRRLKEGQEIVLIDGKGLIAHATIIDPNKNLLAAMVITKKIIDEPKVKVSVAISMPKADRQKTMFDMLAQLGITEIIPLKSEFNINSWTEKLAEKNAKILLEACKQSENPWVPKLLELKTLVACLDEATAKGTLVYYGHTQKDTANIIPAQRNSLVMIGPEGGFSGTELSLLSSKTQQVKPLQIGQHILRTETAAVALTSYFMAFFNN